MADMSIEHKMHDRCCMDCMHVLLTDVLCCYMSMLQEGDEEGDMEAEEAGQSMAVVLHEVRIHRVESNILNVHVHAHVYGVVGMYACAIVKVVQSSPPPPLPFPAPFPTPAQDKKYYPSAEEVYGPEVEVRTHSVCIGVPLCGCMCLRACCSFGCVSF